mgnify:CR=1 FL=1
MRRNIFILGIIGITIFVILTIIIIPKRSVTEKVSLKDLLNKADVALSKNDLLEARRLYEKARDVTDNSFLLDKIKKNIERLNINIIFSPLLDECSIQYAVKPNDTLIKIAKKFGTTVALIKKANGLKSDIIHPQQKLKVNTCKFSIVIDKSQNLLFLKQNDRIVKTYVVSTGKNNSTPTGKFKVANKLKKPVWFKAGAVVLPDSPDNVLGSRWIGLNIKGYGIHGNRNVNDIGKQVTQGCIRMHNKDVEELYDIVPLGTEVIIVN